MNLKSLFNFNFLKENIRKSKGLLAFLLGIIPIVNIIFLIILLTSSNNNLLDFNMLSFLTYAGIIFIPLSLSITLFGFILRKKSVDFVLSKPISRKSIFLTNTIGGIVIILIFMLINTLIFALFSCIFANLTIPFLLLVDYFLFWFISYVFMFIVMNLAIILSGNIITSLIVALIILLLVPYLNGINYLLRGGAESTSVKYDLGRISVSQIETLISQGFETRKKSDELTLNESIIDRRSNISMKAVVSNAINQGITIEDVARSDNEEYRNRQEFQIEGVTKDD